MADSMNSPPPLLDGARVLWWAWAGEIPFGEMPGAEGDDLLIYGFAVCRYDDRYVYWFACNRHWEVVNDMDYIDEEEAKASLHSQYDTARVQWQQYKEKQQ